MMLLTPVSRSPLLGRARTVRSRSVRQQFLGPTIYRPCAPRRSSTCTTAPPQPLPTEDDGGGGRRPIPWPFMRPTIETLDVHRRRRNDRARLPRLPSPPSMPFLVHEQSR